MQKEVIEYSVQNKGSYLEIQAIGTLSNITEFEAYVTRVEKACTEEECSRVLLDERNLIVRTSIEVDLSAKNNISSRRWGSNVTHCACVPRVQDKGGAIFFGWLVTAIHFNYRIFPTLEEADEWLIK